MMIKRCPYGDTEIDYVDLGYRWYVYCYICKTKYFKEDYDKMLEESIVEDKEHD